MGKYTILYLTITMFSGFLGAYEVPVNPCGKGNDPSPLTQLAGQVKQVAKVDLASLGEESGLSEAYCDKTKLGWGGAWGQLEKWKIYLNKVLYPEAKKKSKKARTLVDDSEYVIKGIQDELTDNRNVDNVIFICDASGTLQSVALYDYLPDPDWLGLTYLVTSPYNLDLPSNTRRMVGAGKAALQGVLKISILEGMNGQVKLLSLEGAEDFYRKMGFQNDKNGKFSINKENLLKKFPEFSDFFKNN